MGYTHFCGDLLNCAFAISRGYLPREEDGVTQQDVADAVGAQWMQSVVTSEARSYPQQIAWWRLQRSFRVTADGLLLGSQK